MPVWDVAKQGGGGGGGGGMTHPYAAAAGGLISGLGGAVKGLGDSYTQSWLDEALKGAISGAGREALYGIQLKGPQAVQDYADEMGNILGMRKAETEAARGDINALLEPYMNYDPLGTYKGLRDEGISAVKGIGDYMAGLGRKEYAGEMARLGYAGRPTGSYADRVRMASMSPQIAALFGKALTPGDEFSRIGAEQRAGTGAGLGLIGARGSLIEQQAADAERATMAPIRGYTEMGVGAGQVGSAVAAPINDLYEGTKYKAGWGTRVGRVLEGLGSGISGTAIQAPEGGGAPQRGFNPNYPIGTQPPGGYHPAYYAGPQAYQNPYMFGMPGQGCGYNVPGNVWGGGYQGTPAQTDQNQALQEYISRGYNL